MAYSTISVELPEPLKAYVEARVDAGSFGTPTEYIRELILDDRDRRLARLEERLLQNLSSRPVPFSDEELEHGSFVALCRRKLQESR